MTGFFTNDAEANLDALQAADSELYEHVMDAVDFVIDRQPAAHAQAEALVARDGSVVRATVVQSAHDPPYHAIWIVGDDGPVILGCGRLRGG